MMFSLRLTLCDFGLKSVLLMKINYLFRIVTAICGNGVVSEMMPISVRLVSCTYYMRHTWKLFDVKILFAYAQETYLITY